MWYLLILALWYVIGLIILLRTIDKYDEITVGLVVFILFESWFVLLVIGGLVFSSLWDSVVEGKFWNFVLWRRSRGSNASRL